MVRSLLLTGLMLVAASPAAGQRVPASAPMGSSPAARGGYYNAGGQSWGAPTARARAFARLRSTLLDLREQALALREADGGRLSPEHLAFIQARLDAAQASYRPYRHALW